MKLTAKQQFKHMAEAAGFTVNTNSAVYTNSEYMSFSKDGEYLGEARISDHHVLRSKVHRSGLVNLHASWWPTGEKARRWVAMLEKAALARVPQ